MSACPEVLNWEISTDPGVGAVVPKSVSVAAVWARVDTAKAMTIAATANAFMIEEENFKRMIKKLRHGLKPSPAKRSIH
jgi:hypothetical protein